MKFSKLVLSVVLTLSTVPALAARPLVICGNEDPKGNTELDNLTVVRGGNYENQLVIRNTNIIDDFIKKGAIDRGELNDKGEFIVYGLGNPPTQIGGSLNNRYFAFYREGNGYTLTARLIAKNGIDLSAPIAPKYETENSSG